jgi:4-azaleucine resistance transporter AzlC
MYSMTHDSTSASPRAEFVAGVRDTFPLVVGAIPFGIIYGAVAVTSGLTPMSAGLMSALVFAGSSQFIAAGLVAAGASIPVIVITTFVVNLRHALYSASLGPHLKHLSWRWLVPLGFWLTDETFVVVVRRYEQPDASPHKHWYHLGSSVIMYTNWQVCTWIGILAGQSLPNPGAWGLDFAMVVTFLGMLMPSVRSRSAALAVGAAAVTALLAYRLPNQLGLMLAALAGVGVGVFAKAALRESPAPGPVPATDPQIAPVEATKPAETS